MEEQNREFYAHFMIFDKNYYKKMYVRESHFKVNDEEKPRVSIHVLKKIERRKTIKHRSPQGPQGDGAPTPGHP